MLVVMVMVMVMQTFRRHDITYTKDLSRSLPPCLLLPWTVPSAL